MIEMVELSFGVLIVCLSLIASGYYLRQNQGKIREFFKGI